MFGFFRRPAPQPLSAAIRRALTNGSSPVVGDASSLRMVEMSGRYANRKVTYFRIFDPGTAGQGSAELRHYQDFDACPELVLRSGHVESDGTVILSRSVGPAGEKTDRAQADRSLHADDAHIVRGETGASANSGATAGGANGA